MKFDSVIQRCLTYRFLIVIIALCMFFMFFRLGVRCLWSSDEGRYAEIPREMIETKDFVTPHLNYVKYFEKPVFSYWLTAASYLVLGENVFAARFPVALLGFLTVLATFWFAGMLFGNRAGFFGSLILIATAGFYLVSRYLVIDGPFTFFLTFSMYLFYAGYVRDKKIYFLLSYAFMGLSVLTKGMIGLVLPALIIAPFILITRDFRLLKRAHILTGIVVFLLVAAPWFTAVSVKNPSFFNFFFIREHFYRFFTHAARREAPVFYFLMVGSIFFFPWTLFIPAVVKEYFTCKDSGYKRDLLFLNLWWFVIILFFSVSKSKLPPYILPITPPLAILVGKIWHDFIYEQKNRRFVINTLVACVIGIAGVACAVMGFLVFNAHKDIEAKLLIPYVTPVAALFLITAFIIAWSVFRLRKEKKVSDSFRRMGAVPFYSMAALFLAGYVFVIFGMEKMSLTQSSSVLIEEIKKGFAPESKIAVLDGYEQFSDLGYYFKKRIIIAGDRIGELEFGKEIGDNDEKSCFIDSDRFKKLLEGKDRVYFLLKGEHYQDYKDKIGGSVFLKESKRGMLFVNRIE